MPTLYDVAHFVAWNGYAREMQPYLGVDKAAWTNHEFMFPYTVRMKYGPNEWTRLHLACANGFESGADRVKRVKKLLAYGANPDVKDRYGWSPFMYCARDGMHQDLDIIKVLLDAGADINLKTNHGRTALHIASLAGNIDIVKELIKRGANINICDTEDETALTRAAKKGHTNVCKLLVESGADLSYACRDYVSKNVNTIKYLCSVGCAMPEFAVESAGFYEKRTIIPTLVKLGANPNIGDNTTPLWEAVGDGDAKLVTTLLKCGADPNITPHANWPLLHIAIDRKHYEIAKILGEAGADFSVVDQQGETVFHAIIANYPESPPIEVIKDLLKYVKDFNIVDNVGMTILDWAARCPEIMAEIKKAKARAQAQAA